MAHHTAVNRFFSLQTKLYFHALLVWPFRCSCSSRSNGSAKLRHPHTRARCGASGKTHERTDSYCVDLLISRYMETWQGFLASLLPQRVYSHASPTNASHPRLTGFCVGRPNISNRTCSTNNYGLAAEQSSSASLRLNSVCTLLTSYNRSNLHRSSRACRAATVAHPQGCTA